MSYLKDLLNKFRLKNLQAPLLNMITQKELELSIKYCNYYDYKTNTYYFSIDEYEKYQKELDEYKLLN